MKKMIFALSLMTVLAPAYSNATILPPNNLHLEDNIRAFSNVTEAQFNQIIDDIMAIYVPIAQAKGVTLTVDRRWSSSTVNAYASQSTPVDWNIAMFGGLARRRETTPDGFALVVCHELGHHFGGFAFYPNGDWAASEGQSDYYATQACARRIWANTPEENARSRDLVEAPARQACDAAWNTQEDRDICYRTAMGGKSLGTLLAALRGSSAPEFDTPDQSRVRRTYTAHPAAQCRLDTYFQGGLCTAQFDLDVIPGKDHSAGQDSLDAEQEAVLYSCSDQGGHSAGKRPACWFRANL